MRKKALILTVAMAVTLLLMMSSAVSANQEETWRSKCDLDITYDVYADGVYWLGTVSGDDCAVAGTIRFDAVGEEYFYPGKTMHFVEQFTIWPGSDTQEGDWIKGKNCGVWNLNSFTFRAHGWVTDVSNDEWSDLIGAQYHENGTTTPFFGNPEDLPILAPDGTMKNWGPETAQCRQTAPDSARQSNLMKRHKRRRYLVGLGFRTDDLA